MEVNLQLYNDKPDKFIYNLSKDNLTEHELFLCTVAVCMTDFLEICFSFLEIVFLFLYLFSINDYWTKNSEGWHQITFYVYAFNFSSANRLVKKPLSEL